MNIFNLSLNKKMSYKKIYGIGKTPEQALVYTKVNEIGYGNYSFKKNRVYFVEIPKNRTKVYSFDVDIFIYYNIYNIDRDLSTTEANVKESFESFYDRNTLKKIISIYDNNSDICLCFKVGEWGDNNLYKFLY